MLTRSGSHAISIEDKGTEQGEGDEDVYSEGASEEREHDEGVYEEEQGEDYNDITGNDGYEKQGGANEVSADGTLDEKSFETKEGTVPEMDSRLLAWIEAVGLGKSIRDAMERDGVANTSLPLLVGPQRGTGTLFVFDS
ncbi:hypothetical protein EST38_g14002 [Candolleomyces aberdarensis]|uniref:Uncharacterized protein n=1 Tax=Candolleomyces aberdarensis TaxID=2316362 RepID=A0A4Q2CZK7_9AGAR|nr:hypothetical protein EST38_g14002 [Candolleomyces aberdarensis]